VFNDVNLQPAADEQPSGDRVLIHNPCMLLIVDLLEYAVGALASQSFPDKGFHRNRVYHGLHQ